MTETKITNRLFVGFWALWWIFVFSGMAGLLVIATIRIHSPYQTKEIHV